MCQDSKYGRVLNKYYTIYSTRSNEYLLRDWCFQNLIEDIKWSTLEKELYLLTIFAKSSVLNLWEDSEYVSGFKCVRVLNIHKFLLIWEGSDCPSGCNYGRILNIPGFWVCHWQILVYASIEQSSEYVWIMPYGRVLNMPSQPFTGF